MLYLMQFVMCTGDSACTMVVADAMVMEENPFKEYILIIDNYSYR